MMRYRDFLRTAPPRHVEVYLAAATSDTARVPEGTPRATLAALRRAGVVDAEGKLAGEFLRYRSRPIASDRAVSRLSGYPARVLAALIVRYRWELGELADSLHLPEGEVAGALERLFLDGLAARDERWWYATGEARASEILLDRGTSSR
jgi:hypothetical protein